MKNSDVPIISIPIKEEATINAEDIAEDLRVSEIVCTEPVKEQPKEQAKEPASFHKLDSIMLHWADVNRLLYPTINGQIDTIMQTSTGMWFKLTNRGSFLEIAYGTHADIQEDKKWVRCNDYFVAKQMEKEAMRKIQDERDAKKKAESKPVAVVTKALEDDVI
jgi:hypothetical protein